MIARAYKQEKSLGIDGSDGVVMGQWVWLQGADGGGESGQFGEGERNRDEAGVNRRRSWGGTSALVPELVVGEVPGTGGLPRSLVSADAAAPKQNLFFFGVCGNEQRTGCWMTPDSLATIRHRGKAGFSLLLLLSLGCDFALLCITFANWSQVA